MKKFLLIALLLILTCQSCAFANSLNDIEKQVDTLKKVYSLQSHVEGGYFSEVYTSPFSQNNRATAGSIYFMLVGKDISHFHKIDCDEIWYYHEGCGLKIFVIRDGKLEEFLLGKDIEHGQRAMVIVPANSIFAAENLNDESYTLISCMTTPKFRYENFQLVTKNELKKFYAKADEKILKLAYEKIPE
ncbi:MAG: cupin domain-containing protein [Selenomonadaceae bacterium]|nr:cupin domain-containing protein [Selenomonadaceae bacterium]